MTIPVGDSTADNNVLDLVNANTINSEKETVSIDSPVIAISTVEEKEKPTGLANDDTIWKYVMTFDLV